MLDQYSVYCFIWLASQFFLQLALPSKNRATALGFLDLLDALALPSRWLKTAPGRTTPSSTGKSWIGFILLSTSTASAAIC